MAYRTEDLPHVFVATDDSRVLGLFESERSALSSAYTAMKKVKRPGLRLAYRYWRGVTTIECSRNDALRALKYGDSILIRLEDRNGNETHRAYVELYPVKP